MTADDLTIAERLNTAQQYLEAQAGERPVEAAWGRVLMSTGTAEQVLAALARYQNDDGGFGQGLEPDISAPQSNPFAARLALQVIAGTGIAPDAPLVIRLVDWLERTQGNDGGWRFADGTLDEPISPWFAAWPFPSLNPAMDLAGWLRRLGLSSDRLFAGCRTLYARLANLGEISTGEYYTVLPYAESLPWLPDLPNREAAFDALVARISRDLESGAYDDPQHAAEHIGPADGPTARRIPTTLLTPIIPRLLERQEADGHWPVAYGDAWIPWQTVTGMAILKTYPS